MEALGNGAVHKIFAVVMDFLPGNDAAGAFKKGDGSQQCYTPPTAVLSRVLADQIMKVLTHAASAGFVVICVEGKDETRVADVAPRRLLDLRCFRAPARRGPVPKPRERALRRAAQA
mmetsp:Transcript_25173/g.59220  ORF Transcript_25173/g.59220 Transcript_25173/m.59220 type:complete len:117 (-) Transcript_25173:494-844(-)